MSVWVYKGDKSELIQPELLYGALQGGWSVTRETIIPEKEVKIEDLSILEEKPIHQTRLKAKEAGIEGWDKRRIGKLEEEMNANESRPNK